MSAWEFTETELWRYNTDGVSIYHVFGSITFSRNVLVFAEAREEGGDDADCPHSIVMRRSDNGGKSFYPSVALVPAHGNCYVNPTPLYDSDSRRLFLFFAQNIGGAIETSSLAALHTIPLYLKLAYYFFVAATVVSGAINFLCRKSISKKLSIALSISGLFLFIISRQPYAAIFLLSLLIIKTLALLKMR
jgi:hypothetical protein